MQEERKRVIKGHNVEIIGRRQINITGISDIDSFDEQLVAVFTEVGELIVRGDSLHIMKIDIEAGEITLEGNLLGLEYTDNLSQKSSLWERIFR